MAGVALVSPRRKFVDSSGSPIVGGTLTVYYAGTTNLATTYQDRALTTSNTNPITLDANGECLMWVDDTFLYKELLKDAQGATVSGYPVDNIRGGSASASGVSEITVDRFSGTGAQTQFTLSTTPTNGENCTEVYIGGVYIQKNAYSLAGAVLTFAAAPASGTNNIEVNTFGFTDYQAAATAVAASASAASTSATAAATSATAAAASATAADASADAAAASEAGAAAIVLGNFTQYGTGAVSRTFLAKARERVSILDFIPVAEHAAILACTSTYDCLAAVNTAIDSASFNPLGVNTAGPRIYFPAGLYNFSDTIEIDKTVIIEGDGIGQAGGLPTRFVFAANKTGIRVQRYDTVTNTTYVPTPPYTAGDGSIIRGIFMQGGGGTTGHGIWLRARALVENVYEQGFAQNGCHIVASSGSGGATEGNANNFVIRCCTFNDNGGNGLYIQGADANAGIIEMVDCSGNILCGIREQSFLGNTYIGCHLSGNGYTVAQVHHAGNLYYCNSDTLGAATTPGTDPTVWVLVGAGVASLAYPNWSGAGNYAIGAAIYSVNNTAPSFFLGCYTELGFPPNKMSHPAVVSGGHIGEFTPDSTAFIIDSALGEGRLTNFLCKTRTDNTAGNTIEPHFNITADEVMRLNVTGDAVSGFASYRWNNSIGTWEGRHAGSTARVAYRISTDLTTQTGGRVGVIGPGNYLLPRGVWIGSDETANDIRQHDASSAVPTVGEHAQGDIRYKIDAGAGGIFGWYCVTTGTPGAWRPMGVIPSVSADKGDAGVTLTAGSSDTTNVWNTPLTAPRAAALSTTGVWNGAKLRIVRTAAATGAPTLDVGTGPLKSLAAGQWCDVEYNGSAWMLTAFGSL